MSCGKIASQVGHAFVECSRLADPSIYSEYRYDSFGTKVVLVAPNLQALLKAYQDAQALGLTCFLVEDSGPNVFDGIPTITALGIGPCYRNKVTSRFNLLP
jgi:peptidyl-tRNA hydrolase